MTSEQPAPDVEAEPVTVEPAAEPAQSVSAEPTPIQSDATMAQGEEWIEEYEAEKKEKRPRKKVPHLLGIIITVSIILMLVVWTLLSPQVLPVSGSTYIRSPTYASLGNYTGDLEIRWLLNTILVADTSWGLSMDGDQQVTAGDVVSFNVLITKVSEEMKNPWFVGTSIKLKNAAMYTEDGTKVGTLVGKTFEDFGTIAEIEATFDAPGNYTCYVYTEITIYGKMLIGYVPVKVLRMTAYLDADVIVT